MAKRSALPLSCTTPALVDTVLRFYEFMNDAERLLAYLAQKRALLAAALAYAENPSEGQMHVLRVQAQAYASARSKSRIDTPILEEP